MEALALIRDILTLLFCFLVVLFGVSGTIGLLRSPDTYIRLQTSSLAGTSSTFSAFLAALISCRSLPTAGRILLIIIFFLISCPTTTHIIARYAWYSGIDPWAPVKERPKGRRRGRPGPAAERSPTPGAVPEGEDG